MVDEKWLPDLIERAIPMSNGIKPLVRISKQERGMPEYHVLRMPSSACHVGCSTFTAFAPLSPLPFYPSPILLCTCDVRPNRLSHCALSSCSPLQDMLTTDAAKARWNNEGLPTDPLSIENGAIMSSASRWSLMIDPQLQGIKWIINKEEPNGLVIIQQSQHKYIDKVGWGKNHAVKLQTLLSVLWYQLTCMSYSLLACHIACK